MEKAASNQDIRTCSKVHVKKEVVFGKPWPRMIAAREDGLRSVSAALYEKVAHQVYAIRPNGLMIKGLTDQEIIPHMIEKLGLANNYMCVDISSYDSAQRGIIWEIERALFERILGVQGMELWSAIALNTNVLRGHHCSSVQPTCRNSGEMTTALTNTLLSELLARYAAKKFKGEVRTSTLVEGDDNITALIGSEEECLKYKDHVLNTYDSLGFSATIESYGPI